MELVATLVALGIVATVIWRTFRGPSSRRAGGAGSSPAPAGLLAALALVTVSPSGAVGDGQSVSVLALGLGAMAAIAAVADTFRPLADWAYGAIGAVAAVPAMVELVAGPVCPGGVNLGGRVMVVVALMLAAGSAVAGVLVFGRIGPMPMLAWFGVVEILAFLQAPGGLALPVSGVGPATLALVIAAALGMLAALRPNLVVTAATVCISLANMGLNEAQLACQAVPGLSGAVATVLVLYLAAFLGLRALLRWFRR